jgi:23S rRNA pseudouridine1911/1915/1917 synthase
MIAERPPSETPPSSEAPEEQSRIVAGLESRGERVDRFLATAIGTISRSRVKSLIEAGQARCDGTIVDAPAELVRPGSVYTLTVPPPVPARPLPQGSAAAAGDPIHHPL